MRRNGSFVGVLAALLLTIFVPAASAHSAAGSPSSNYRTVIDSLTPKPTTFRLKVIEEGSRLQVTWLSGDPVIVPGYQDEPYLKIGSDGVYENARSAATYVNKDRMGTTELPESVDEDAAPQWRRTSSGQVARFHDHRAHWMLPDPPEKVRTSPDAEQLIQEFLIELRQGDAATKVVGRVLWVPGPSPLLKYLGAVVAALLLVMCAVWAGVNARRRKVIRPLIITALIALIVVDVTHLLGIVGGVEGGSVIGRMISIGYASFAAWVMAIVAIVLWQRGRDDALYLATFAAGLMTLVGGVADISILRKSSIVFAWADELARWSVALTLGLGIGIVIAAVLLTKPVLPNPALIKAEASSLFVAE
jgi:hypothetical protein